MVRTGEVTEQKLDVEAANDVEDMKMDLNGYIERK